MHWNGFPNTSSEAPTTNVIVRGEATGQSGNCMNPGSEDCFAALAMTWLVCAGHVI
jgi:hypothetical protein